MATKTVKRVQPNKGTVAVEVVEPRALAYCMKCSEKVEIQDPKRLVISSKNAIAGTCPSCKEKVFKFVKPEVPKSAKGVPKPKAKARAKPKAATKPKASPAPTGLSAKAKKASDAMRKAGTLDANWFGTVDGVSVWFTGSEKRGWTITHDPIPDDWSTAQFNQFKKLLRW